MGLLNSSKSGEGDSWRIDLTEVQKPELAAVVKCTECCRRTGPLSTEITKCNCLLDIEECKYSPPDARSRTELRAVLHPLLAALQTLVICVAQYALTEETI
jgi:hypothetical protein